MSDDLTVRAITVDAARNRLVLHLGEGRGHGTPSRELSGPSARATLDIGTGGRLLGVEVVGRYLAVATPDPADTALAREVTTPVELDYAADAGLAAVAVPRRCEGYEITYPSGNR